MAKIKTKRLPKLETWARDNNVPLEVAKHYQTLRRRFMNNATAFSRRHNIPQTAEIPRDIRLYRRNTKTFDDFLDVQVEQLINKSENTAFFIKQRMINYASNLGIAMAESPQYSGTKTLTSYLDWVNKAKTSDLAKLLRITRGAGLKLVYRTRDAINGTLKKDRQDHLTLDDLIEEVDFAAFNADYQKFLFEVQLEWELKNLK